MSSRFTPSNAIDLSKERDWGAGLGMLDWDDTSIVFTKRTLIEFLKYTGTTVDTNYNNISKLPRYAIFGKLKPEPEKAVDESDGEASSNEFRPSRRVRDVPGGQHTDIFAQGDEDDALSTAPPKEGGAGHPLVSVEYNRSDANTASEDNGEHEGIDFESSFRPSRRVRETPGGKSSLANFWDSSEQDAFKPTRRVRERPGGADHISGLF